jgi:hypothetical protein
MTQQNPITPPPELVQQWRNEGYGIPGTICSEYVATRAAQWGFVQANADIERKLQEAADQELEACCEWMADETPTNYINALRAARRPKPPSLKEQALALINHDPANQPFLSDKGIDTIRRALESIPDPS